MSWHIERNATVADGLLELARIKEADTLVCGISGYRWVQVAWEVGGLVGECVRLRCCVACRVCETLTHP